MFFSFETYGRRALSGLSSIALLATVTAATATIGGTSKGNRDLEADPVQTIPGPSTIAPPIPTPPPTLPGPSAPPNPPPVPPIR
jgi:hypothetical protein